MSTIRKRFTLLDKKRFVDEFHEERKKKIDVNQEISIRSFCKINNIKNDAMLSKWIHMDKLGQLNYWGGKNNLSKCNFSKKVNVLDLINEALTADKKLSLSTNNIVIKQSILVPTEYGAFAKKNLKENQHIGYYCGELVKNCDTISNYKHYIDKEHVLDSSNITACHARFINDSTCGLCNVKFVISKKTNIDVQNKIQLITLKKIKKDEELLIDYGKNYWKDTVDSLHSHDTAKRKFSEMSNAKSSDTD